MQSYLSLQFTIIEIDGVIILTSLKKLLNPYSHLFFIVHCDFKSVSYLQLKL